MRTGTGAGSCLRTCRQQCRPDAACVLQDPACFKTGSEILNYWGYASLSVGGVFGVMLAFWAGTHIVSYLALRSMRERR